VQQWAQKAAEQLLVTAEKGVQPGHVPSLASAAVALSQLSTMAANSMAYALLLTSQHLGSDALGLAAPAVRQLLWATAYTLQERTSTGPAGDLPLCSSSQMSVLKQTCFGRLPCSADAVQLLHTLHMLLSTQAAAEAGVYGKHRLPAMAGSITEVMLGNLQQWRGLSTTSLTPTQLEEASELVLAMAHCLGQRERLKHAPLVTQLAAALSEAASKDDSRAKAAPWAAEHQGLVGRAQPGSLPCSSRHAV
jgi:hypothetical protein